MPAIAAPGGAMASCAARTCASADVSGPAPVAKVERTAAKVEWTLPQGTCARMHPGQQQHQAEGRSIAMRRGAAVVGPRPPGSDLAEAVQADKLRDGALHLSTARAGVSHAQVSSLEVLKVSMFREVMSRRPQAAAAGADLQRRAGVRGRVVPLEEFVRCY